MLLLCIISLLVFFFFFFLTICLFLTWLSKEQNQSYYDQLTFASIISVMKRGATKQLDFEDLLLLPTDMDPSTCHDKLLACWQTQQSKARSDPSLFKAICYAYGGQYLCLGFLKVS